MTEQRKQNSGSPGKGTSRRNRRSNGAGAPGGTASGKPSGGKPRTPSARELAMDILTRIETEHSYSNLLLNQSLQKHELERQEAGLVTELVYGTIQRMNTIDYFLDRFVAKGVAKLQPWVRALLRLSFYQLYYLDRIPVHAAVNEAVNIAKRRGHQGISGMVNGVLRNVHRSMDTLTLPADLPAVRRIALEHSHPEWMVARWAAQYGEEEAAKLAASNNAAPHVSVRANANRLSRAELLAQLEREGVSARPSVVAPAGVVIENAGNMAHSPWFRQGLLTMQDESSMLVAEVVDPQPGMSVLDCCAAPGGKTTHLAEKMSDRGKITANDVHPHKEALVAEQASRLGLSSIRTAVGDAKELAGRFAPGSFDRILLDAPCSGLGVIRRKPDAKWTKRESEIGEIADLQYDILRSVAGLLRKDGVLVYSTCTIEPEENEKQVQRFLSEHPDYQLDTELDSLVPRAVLEKARLSEGMLQILPQHFHTDGFFIARLRKIR
ncbi:16S rRNA (cytosine(967)-C(5))-methyltransferase RsmB [Paenibacillus gansuensis]|uniref:16S rRNA (cytosine(967)-C(5))-methyltransferase n=1 Tax=Paenibacillus gansuensis TaxID=306542 RepID=A0ABW5PCT0_9BACL